MISSTLCSFVFFCAQFVVVCAVRLGDKDTDTDKDLVLVLGLVSDYEKEKGFGSEDFSFLEIGNQYQKQNQRRLRALVYGL